MPPTEPSLPPTHDFAPQTPAHPPGAADTAAELKTTPNTDDPNRTTDFTTTAAAPAALPTIPGFAIERELGRGGMGVVYKATQLGLDRHVALKMILKADFATQAQKLRFQIEAENAARVQHPNIVQVYEIGEHQGQPYFALEYVEGGSLADEIKRRRFTPKEAAELVETLARAVHAAHLQGIIHRDLKPANILMAGVAQPSGGRKPAGDLQEPESLRPPLAGLVPKIADFGLAKRLDATADLTDSGAILGTPTYMSPEQARGQGRHVGPAADQYALGVILYQLLTHHLPFTADSIPLLLRKIAEDEPADPRGHAPSLPPDLAVICLKCMAKDPAQRYSSAEALAEDLRNWREHRPITARPATRTERVVKWCRRYPAVAGLVVVSVVAAVGAGGLAWWALQAEAAALVAAEEESKATLLADIRRKEAETNLAFAKKGNNILSSIFIDLDPYTGYQTVAELRNALRDNLDKAVQELDGSSIGDPLEVAAMQNTLGESLKSLGEAHRAILLFEKASQCRSAKLGSDHPLTLNSLNGLAGSYQNAGQIAKAIPLFEETLKRNESKLGRDHLSTLIIMDNLAGCYRDAGQITKALSLQEETLKLKKAVLGPDHPSTLASVGSRGTSYYAAGQFAKALPLLEEALKVYKARHGPDHPRTLASMDNLAITYRAVGQLAEALPLLEEAYKLKKTKLGLDHPSTLTSINNLAITYQTAGQFAKALPLLELVLTCQRAKLGPDHPDTLISMNNLATFHVIAGQIGKAVPLFEEALISMKAKLGPDHPNTFALMSNLAAGYRTTGQISKALKMYEDILSHQKTKLGLDHPTTLTSMNNLATAYQAGGQLDKALPLFEETLRLKKAKLGSDHADTLMTMKNLAVGYQAAGRLVQALPLFEEAARGIEKRGFQSEHARLILINAINAYEAGGQFDQAESWRQKLLAFVKEQDGADSTAYASELATWSRSLLRRQKWVDAETTIRECLAIREHKQPDVWTTYYTHTLLGSVLLGQQKYADAEPHLLKGYEGIKARAKSIPPEGRPRLSEAAARLVKLYEATNNPAEAKKWRDELAKLKAAPATAK